MFKNCLFSDVDEHRTRKFFRDPSRILSNCQLQEKLRTIYFRGSVFKIYSFTKNVFTSMFQIPFLVGLHRISEIRTLFTAEVPTSQQQRSIWSNKDQFRAKNKKNSNLWWKLNGLVRNVCEMRAGIRGRGRAGEKEGESIRELSILWVLIFVPVLQLVLKSETRYFSKGCIIADSNEEAKELMVITSGQVVTCQPKFDLFQKGTWSCIYCRWELNFRWIQKRQTKRIRPSMARPFYTSLSAGDYLHHCDSSMITIFSDMIIILWCNVFTLFANWRSSSEKETFPRSYAWMAVILLETVQ